ncbi:hypothetical protein [Nitrospina watsonii]|uniref:Uncharacterized protein n=1 Tax=Nitrospina watsonii TaxID=1323948 RepID=A0ABM9HDL4_9BACT|nr:hypothetical protein [Nitrospina watsonii]CAI2718280.1 conserved protein of unknown function [Nitrospina watsonii]
MTTSSPATPDVFALSDRIQVLPVVHGSGDFTREVRQRLLASGCDCLAVCLPPEFESTVQRGLQQLPTITISCMEEEDGTVSYVPIDPSQPVIMALRIARQENIPCEFIDLSLSHYEPRQMEFPDTLALQQVSMEKFAVSMLPFLPKPEVDSQMDKRCRWMAHQLHRLQIDRSKIVFVCSVLDWPWIKQAFDERAPYPQPETPPESPTLYSVHPDTLFFALAEFPYITYLYEQRREAMRSDKNVAIDGVKEILLRAREKFLQKYKVRYHNLTQQSFQIFLQYVRNLTLMEHRFTPDLYTLAVAAKQIGGDPFAIALVDAAREYPFQQEGGDPLDSVALGIDQATFGEDEPVTMKNRLSETALQWRTLNLKPEPDIVKKEEYKYRWDPYGQCSWPPEDEKIENLNSHIREQTRHLLAHDLARTEKFTTSVKDGIDLRDTLRNWHTGDIYVKEIPASRGNVEVVVFLFEMEPEPDRYSWRQTWYAEHENESTLCFFATNYMDNLIGPGIGEATYGGCMLIYPPRPISNVWEDPRLALGETLEEKLLEAAFFHSKERHVTVVAPGAPPASWRRLARHYNRRILHIPLKRLSSQTIERVRRFHVLNGKHIRSYATRFIQEL